METIHRRNRQTPSNAAGASNTCNGASSQPPRVERRSYGPPIKARPTTENPYTATTTLADVFLLRSIQFMLSLAAVWFLYLVVAINSPSLDANPSMPENNGRNDGVYGEGSNLLRGPSSLPKNIATLDPNDFSTTREKITQLRMEFYKRYGGETAAKAMLGRGLRTFDSKSGNAKNGKSSVRSTADRFLSAIVRHESFTSSSSSSEQPEFVMAFAGYSVTVGRGNHLEQSYPFILEGILTPILKSPPLGIKLTVRNSAIGGIPSFPYGWCLSNFLGEDADLVSWDYGMNEGNGASGLESYVRQALMMPKSPPLFVLLDMKRPRLDLLQKYVDMGALPDPIALAGRDAVDKKLLELPEVERPTGLRKWNEWGAPKGAPGQSPWHPKKMEHELMGWMLAMRMLDALDVALEEMEDDTNWRSELLERQQHQSHGSAEVFLPAPVTDVSKTGAASLLHGSALKTDKSKWHMNHISCRTSFLPNISGDLKSIVQSGVTKYEEDMLQTRDDSLFNLGWVMDVGKLERDTKLKVQKYGGLGYIDMKTALYGIPSSGTLKLWLPYEGHAANQHLPASQYYSGVVLCEVNEKRGDDECNMMSDLAFRVGDVVVPTSKILQVKGVASYLKKEICIFVDTPEGAKLSYQSDKETGRFGLAVEVSVTGARVSIENGACSISHVIWENQ